MKDTVGSCIVGRVSQLGQVKCTPKGSINELLLTECKEVIVKNSLLITDAGKQIWIW